MMTKEYEGQGGSYSIDKQTGERVLIERTDAPTALGKTTKPRKKKDQSDD